MSDTSIRAGLWFAIFLVALTATAWDTMPRFFQGATAASCVVVLGIVLVDYSQRSRT